jgi:hypothetical protein
MDVRQERGRSIAARLKIEKKHGLYIVPSESGKGRYWVRPEQPHCTCPDFELRGQPCKHIFAVEFFVQGEQGGVIAPTVAEATEPTKRQRKTYPQVWPAYNAAQTNEKDQFQCLLADLCRGIPDPPRKPGTPGHKPVKMADIVFGVVFKVYSALSGRRFMCDLREAERRGHVGQAYHYNSLSKHMEMEGLAPILRDLIGLSRLPLRAIETKFAVDSSGFTTPRFVRWYDARYGRETVAHHWVKVHLMCGVVTNVVTAVIIDDKHAGDCPMFAPLVKATAENFGVDEVSADKAYLRGDNFEAVETLGGTAYIPFKSNTTAAGGGLYETMYHLFCLNREEYLKHYHLRSNIESTFSMVKAKFGDHLRSKADTAMINEALCKILCHNICCLIQAMYELGIKPAFREDKVPQGQCALL